MRASKSRKEGDIKVVGRRRKDKRDGIDWLIEDTGVYNLQINNNITSIGSDQKITVIWLTVDIKIILELHSCEEKMQKIQNQRKSSNKKILFFLKKIVCFF